MCYSVNFSILSTQKMNCKKSFHRLFVHDDETYTVQLQDTELRQSLIKSVILHSLRWFCSPHTQVWDVNVLFPKMAETFSFISQVRSAELFAGNMDSLFASKMKQENNIYVSVCISVFLSLHAFFVAITGAIIFQNNPNHNTLSQHYHSISENITKG